MLEFQQLKWEMMKNKKNKEIKLYPKMGITLLWLIPCGISLFILLIITILGREYWVSLYLFIIIFVGLGLPFWKIRFFAEKYFCLFNIFYGLKKYAYRKIKKIESNSNRHPITFSVFFEEKKGLKTAKFETGSYEYMADILNFLKDKVEDGVIKECSFKEVGIEYENGKYRYLSYMSRHWNRK